jgi:DHHA1 domain
MQNAHLRLGQLEYLRSTANIQTRIRLQVDRYMGEEADGHLLSLYGGDAEIGAIAAAIHEKHPFTLTFPDGKSKTVSMGADGSCYRGSVAVPGRKQPLRHLVAVSQALHANGAAGKILASRVRERYGVPSSVLVQDSRTGMAVGSGRSVEGFSLIDALRSCQSVLHRFGGHEQAAGVTLTVENIPVCQQQFESFVGQHPPSRTEEPAAEADLDLESAGRIFHEQLRLLEPFGIGKPERAARSITAHLLNCGFHPNFYTNGGHIKRSTSREQRRWQSY